MARRRPWREAACTALLAALLSAGCGGSGGDQAVGATLAPITSLRTSSLPKAEFLKRAVAHCNLVRRQAVRKYFGYLHSHGLKFSRAAIASNAQVLFDQITAPTYELEVQGIRALGAPRGDERRVLAILNAIQHGIEVGREKPLGYFYGESPFRPAYVLAGPYGLGPCATG
jgi:hypothetical protein